MLVRNVLSDNYNISLRNLNFHPIDNKFDEIRRIFTGVWDYLEGEEV